MAVDMNMNILIVDDYSTMLRIIKNLLKQLGFSNIDEAMDGGQAYDLVKQKSYGLIISDWNMEPVSGIDFLRNIRTSGEGYAKTPFIMITAESKTENVILAKQAGVNNYIVKPFNAETLKTKMEAVLGSFN